LNGKENHPRSGSGAGDRAEALVEGVPVFDGNGLGEAARRDRELIEEADAAEENEAIAVPVRDEPTGACWPIFDRSM
jgi:hypothetical protein